MFGKKTEEKKTVGALDFIPPFLRNQIFDMLKNQMKKHGFSFMLLYADDSENGVQGFGAKFYNENPLKDVERMTKNIEAQNRLIDQLEKENEAQSAEITNLKNLLNKK